MEKDFRRLFDQGLGKLDFSNPDNRVFLKIKEMYIEEIRSSSLSVDSYFDLLDFGELLFEKPYVVELNDVTRDYIELKKSDETDSSDENGQG